jgi:cation transport ATPase
MFRTKFWVSLALTVPTVIWGHMLAPLVGLHAPIFPGSRWIAPVFGTAVFAYGGRVFLEGAWRELGIDTVFAEVLPEQKVEKVRQLKAGGRRVAMVGDGVNDAPALLTSDVGIAIGAGTDVAVEAGDIVLVRNDPRDVARAIELSKASYRKMLQNLWWAAGYNVVAIPLAAGVLAGYGILLYPAVAAILMSASTVVVAINAQLLRSGK